MNPKFANRIVFVLTVDTCRQSGLPPPNSLMLQSPPPFPLGLAVTSPIGSTSDANARVGTNSKARDGRLLQSRLTLEIARRARCWVVRFNQFLAHYPLLYASAVLFGGQGVAN